MPIQTFQKALYFGVHDRTFFTLPCLVRHHVTEGHFNKLSEQ